MISFELTKKRLRTAMHMTVLLLVACFCSGFVQASCGDYVHRRNAHVQHSVNDLMPVEAGVQAKAVSKLPESPSQPCSGPGCRSLPFSQPMPIATSQTLPRVSEVVAIVERHDSLANHASNRDFDFGDDRPERGFPPRIDIPPECAAAQAA